MDNVRKWKKHRRPRRDAPTPPTVRRDPVPFITVQGNRYYSDRFYLNKTIYDDDDDSDDSGDEETPKPKTSNCTCGAHAAPPLLDRAALIASLDLKAAILSSYTLSHTSWLVQREFPSLLGPNSTVPTLVLHGKKAWSPNAKKDNSKKMSSSNNDHRTEDMYETDSGGEEEEFLMREKRKMEVEHGTVAVNQEQAAADDESDSDDDSGFSLDTQPEEEETHVKKKSKVAAVPPPPPASITTTQNTNDLADTTNHSNARSNDFKVATKPPPSATLAATSHDTQKATASSGSGNKKKNRHFQHHQQKKKKPSAVSTCPSHVHWTEVLPCWIPPTDVPAVYAAAANDDDDNEQQDEPESSFSVSPMAVEKRKSKRGVHHPKFMILFETSGSVIVVVSTANLTPQRTTDGTWMQRFPPSSLLSATDANDDDNNAAASSSSCNGITTSDFGKTLAHLLQCQTWAARQGQWTPEAFCRKYLGFDKEQASASSEFPCALRDLYKRYDFSQAQVHLVSHVPGDYPGESSSSTVSATFRPYHYGRQRVANILEGLSKSSSSSPSNDDRGGNNDGFNNGWLPTSIVDQTDRLVIQPTSFGADWTPSNMADVVQSYLKLPVGFRDPSSSSTTNDVPTTRDWMQRTDIVWPTDDFMRQASDDGRNKTKQHEEDDSDMGDDRVSPTSALQMGLDDSDDDELAVSGDGKRDNSGFIFLSSETFNRIHTDCLSRMVMFQQSSPSQHPSKPSPHFKSIARLYNGTNHRLQDYSLGESNTQLSWFLLTSACLSLGAQGERSSTSKKQELSALPRGGSSETISFSNFELGVLFCSRLQGRPQSDRLYCWRPAECSCGTADKVTEYSKLIHLPVPFSFRRSPYQKDPGEMAFCETPYFNEIPPGTAGVGHMMYTPYGAAVAAELDRQEG